VLATVVLMEDVATVALPDVTTPEPDARLPDVDVFVEETPATDAPPLAPLVPLPCTITTVFEHEVSTARQPNERRRTLIHDRVPARGAMDGH
jgi:hypothetical protein